MSSTATWRSTPPLPDERLARRQIDQRADRLARALHRPHLEPLRHREQEDDAGRLEPFAEQQGAGDRDDHQRVDVEACASGWRSRARRAGKMPPATAAAMKHAAAAVARPAADNARPAPIAAAQATISRQRHAMAAPPTAGSSCSSHIRMPVWPDGVDDRGRGQLGGVIFDVQPLADEIGRYRLEPGERLEPAFEDDNLLVAVHPLDAEHGLRVELARRAGDGLG